MRRAPITILSLVIISSVAVSAKEWTTPDGHTQTEEGGWLTIDNRVSANLETMHHNRDGTATVTVYLRDSKVYRQWIFLCGGRNAYWDLPRTPTDSSQPRPISQYDPYASAIQVAACLGRTFEDIPWEKVEKDWLSGLEVSRNNNSEWNLYYEKELLKQQRYQREREAQGVPSVPR